MSRDGNSSLSETVSNGSLTKRTLFNVLTDRSPRPTLVTNSDVEIIYVNKAWEQQFGYSFEEVYQKNPRIFQSGRTPRHVYTYMWKALKADKTFQTDKIIDRRKNGRLFNMFSTVFPIHLDNSIYYVQILDDITKRKKLQEYQGAFIKVAAHDIRSPLAGIQLMSELLAAKVGQHPRDDLEGDIQSLQDEVVRMGQLVSTLLDISLFESGKVKLRLERIHIHELIDEAIEHVHRFAPSQHFHTQVIDDIFVPADRGRIQQVLINLLENSIKYTASDQPIIISAVQKDDTAVVSVLDRGPGISKKVATRIFEPFYRTAHAKKTKVVGHGLGLHIVHRIIQAHHGHIWVKPRKGGGSIFSFTLPLKRLHF